MREKERQILEAAFASELAEQKDYFAPKFAETRDWCDLIIRTKVIEFLAEYRSDFALLSREEFAAGNPA